MELSNSVAIVTGGASGLGAATAKVLATKGARVTVFDLNESLGRSFADSIGADFIAVDVVDEAGFSAALEQVNRRHGIARILVNCAGIIGGGRLLGFSGPHPLEDFRRVLDINLIGTFNANRLVAAALAQAPELDRGERGVLINTASVSAFEGQIGQVAYSAAKAGVVGMTLTTARELSDVGIRCNAIAPGVFETAMVDKMPPAVRDSLLATVPFPKRFGEAEEFAHMVVAICENQMLNGETIRLDGAVRFQPR